MNVDKVSLFLDSIKEVAEDLAKNKNFLIIFSDDGDGLSSAYLFVEMLDYLNKEYRLIVLDKAFPEAVERIFEYEFDRYIFLDIGGAFYYFIPRHKMDNVIVIDHHTESVKFPYNIKYINPYTHGFKEEETPVSSVISYYIFKSICREAPKYAWIALIGMGEHPYELQGLNWRVIYEGIKFGNIKKSGKSYSIYHRGFRREYKSLYRDITLISSAGYFDEMPIELIAHLKFGDEAIIKEYSEKYRIMRKNAYDKLTSLLEEGLFVKNNIQWFEDYKKLFYDMGTRIFDSYVTYVSHQARLYDKDKYLIGISHRKPYIPGLGYLRKEWLNIAIRVSKKMEYRIKYGHKPPVSAITEAAAYSVGGLGYGYPSKASCVIPYGMKDDFLMSIEELAGGK